MPGGRSAHAVAKSQRLAEVAGDQLVRSALGSNLLLRESRQHRDAGLQASTRAALLLVDEAHRDLRVEVKGLGHGPLTSSSVGGAQATCSVGVTVSRSGR